MIPYKSTEKPKKSEIVDSLEKKEEKNAFLTKLWVFLTTFRFFLKHFFLFLKALKMRFSKECFIIIFQVKSGIPSVTSQNHFVGVQSNRNACSSTNIKF